MSRKNLPAHLIAILLLGFASLAGAVDLTVNRKQIVIGENVTVKLKSPPAFSEIDWTHSPGLTRLEAERGKIRFRGATPGVATVTVLIDGKPEGSITVTILDPGETAMPAGSASETPLPSTVVPPYSPPAYAPPAYAPPAYAPPAYAPPATAAPVYAAPVATPPAYTPPAAAQPIQAPPMYQPPARFGGRDYTSPAAVLAGAPVQAPATPSSSLILTQPSVLTLIQNYHWNNGLGAYPGTIALVDVQGRQHGPWLTTGSAGPGGVPNVYWSARPMVTLPAGTYTVIDSDPTTWTPDPQNGGRGFSRHETQAVTPGYGQLSGTSVGAYPGYTGSSGWAQPGQAGAATGLPGGYGQPTGNAQGGMPGASYPGGWPSQGTAQVAGQTRALLEIGNGQPVGGTPVKPSKLDLAAPHVITLIRTYHWNNGQGAYPGSIGLRCRDGSNHGPWQAVGEPSPEGVQNAYWTVRPNAQLPACVCTVVVSDPQSWSQNDGSKKRGFVRVEGYPIGPATGQAIATGNDAAGTALETLERAHDTVRKMDETKRALESLKNIFK